jgi:endonuclease/exonuclease/phosphatase family metal-dependent hydrolase
MHMIWLVIALVAALVGQPAKPPGPPPPPPPASASPSVSGAPSTTVAPASLAMRVGVLTFNIRYGTANDGENAWTKRREQVFEILRDERLGVIGLQEALRAQLDDIHGACPKLGEIGVGRDDGKQAGEYSAILYRTDEWKPGKTGTFWLSETPETSGSMSWKTACTRVCTWARLERFGDPAGATRVLWVFNTHMDHVSGEARSKGARLIARRIAERGDAEPFVVTGDFNSGEEEEAARYFLSPPAEGPSASPLGKLADTFRVLHAADKEAGTFQEFDPKRTLGKKIDYVLVASGTKVVESWIDHRSKEGRAASDHFPVGAIVEFVSTAVQVPVK